MMLLMSDIYKYEYVKKNSKLVFHDSPSNPLHHTHPRLLLSFLNIEK